MLIQETEEKALSPQEVRNILQADNKEIIKLCKKASIIPKKNQKGQTVFSLSEVEKLKSVKNSSQKNGTSLVATDSQVVVNSLLSTLATIEKNITESMSKVIDEKLDGMDEVVVELIRCKTENESLRQKMNELNKENYHLKTQIKSYKSLGMGFYVKKAVEDFSL